MDNLTHAMTGMLLSRAGLNRVAPRATLTLLLAANAPDIDIVTRGWGSLAYLRYHRGLTHSLAALPLLAALVVAVMWLIGRRDPGGFRWGRTFLVALAGVATHPLMDLTNIYGIRPWLPFSNTWYSWDITFIVDIWLWIALLAALVVPALGRLISGEIGARPGSGTGAAVAALVFLAGWWGARDLLHRRAEAMLEAHLYGFNPAAASDPDAAPAKPEGVAPLRVAAFPTPTNPLVWRGLVETERFYQIVDFDVRRPLDPTAGRILYKPENAPALEAALRSPTAAAFSSFARYPYATVDRREEGYRVVLVDLRFPFRCTIDLDRQMRVVAERFTFS